MLKPRRRISLHTWIICFEYVSRRIRSSKRSSVNSKAELFQGNSVFEQNFVFAIFQYLGSVLATLPAAKVADFCGCLPGHALEIAEAEDQTFEETLHALGKIEAFPGKRQSVSSRIAGRAVRVLALPDHEVKAGDPLVVVESRQPGEPPPQLLLG